MLFCSLFMRRNERQAHNVDTASAGTAVAIIAFSKCPSNTHSESVPASKGPAAPNTDTTKLHIAKLRARKVAGVRSCSMVGTRAFAVLVMNSAVPTTTRAWSSVPAAASSMVTGMVISTQTPISKGRAALATRRASMRSRTPATGRQPTAAASMMTPIACPISPGRALNCAPAPERSAG